MNKTNQELHDEMEEIIADVRARLMKQEAIMQIGRAAPEPKDGRCHNGTSQAIGRCIESLEKLAVLVDMLENKLQFILLPSDTELSGLVNIPSGVCPVAQSIHQLAVRSDAITEQVDRMIGRIDQ